MPRPAEDTRTTDITFVVGLLTALLWCGAQALKALSTTQGVSLAQYVAFALGFMMQLLLAIEGRKKAPGRKITQHIWMFGAWSVCSVILISVVMTRGWYQWSPVDSAITKVAAIGILTTTVWAFYTKKHHDDAAVRAWVNISLKSLPQFLLIAKIWSEGSAGITTIAIVLGHTSIIVRLFNIQSSIRTEGGNREKYWLYMSDAINLVSWVAVTVVWWVMK